MFRYLQAPSGKFADGGSSGAIRQTRRFETELGKVGVD
jgi:hypothetical protein